jgi:hypothetical protein
VIILAVAPEHLAHGGAANHLNRTRLARKARGIPRKPAMNQSIFEKLTECQPPAGG